MFTLSPHTTFVVPWLLSWKKMEDESTLWFHDEWWNWKNIETIVNWKYLNRETLHRLGFKHLAVRFLLLTHVSYSNEQKNLNFSLVKWKMEAAIKILQHIIRWKRGEFAKTLSTKIIFLLLGIAYKLRLKNSSKIALFRCRIGVRQLVWT